MCTKRWQLGIFNALVLCIFVNCSVWCMVTDRDVYRVAATDIAYYDALDGGHPERDSYYNSMANTSMVPYYPSAAPHARLTSESAWIKGLQAVIYLFQQVEALFNQYRSEFRVAKCVAVYSYSFLPFSEYINKRTILQWISGYFVDEGAREVLSLLVTGVFSKLAILLASFE